MSWSLSNAAAWAGGIASLLFILEFFGVKERLHKIKGWAKWRVVLFVLSLLVLGAGLYGNYSSRQVTPENVQIHVRDWLEDFGVENQKADIPKSRFRYLTTTYMNTKMTIGQPIDHPSFLVVGWKTSLSENRKRTFESKPYSERHQFWEQLISSLLAANHQIEANEAQTTVTIEKWLPITNDLTEGVFYDAVEQVQRGAVIVQNAFSQFFGPVSPPSPSTQPSSLTPNKEASPP
jgi:hypothetical protein